MRGWILAALIGACIAVPALADIAPPPPEPPPPHVAFPAIHNWHTLKITLRRTMCFGSCPSYHLEIAGNGTVTWWGDHFVAAVGQRTRRIPQADVRTLYKAFRDADFFALDDAYQAHVTDLPSTIIGISFDGHKKTVTDYAGRMIGMPAAVTDLEALVDKMAKTERWTRPAPGP